MESQSEVIVAVTRTTEGYNQILYVANMTLTNEKLEALIGTLDQYRAGGLN